MANYKGYNGTEYDYDRDTGLLDSGNRQFNRKYGITNPNIDMDEYDGDYEPCLYDEDCW